MRQITTQVKQIDVLWIFDIRIFSRDPGIPKKINIFNFFSQEAKISLGQNFFRTPSYQPHQHASQARDAILRDTRAIHRVAPVKRPSDPIVRVLLSQ